MTSVTAIAERRPELAVGGRIVTPDAVIDNGAVVVSDGIVSHVMGGRDALEAIEAAARTVGGLGRLVMPGVVDAHVHSFSDPGETFDAATAAAAAGGVTTILDMPYDSAGPIGTAEAVVAKRALIAEQARVDVGLMGTVHPGEGVAAIEGMVEAGVVGFKVSLFETDPVRFPRLSTDEILQAATVLSHLGVRMGVHAEDGEIINALVAVARAAGRVSPIDHCRTRPPESETASVALGLELARAAEAPFHIFHASVPRSIELVAFHKAHGLAASVETCPHYLVLDESDMSRLGAKGKINPPLRTAAATQAMWRYLADGSIDIVTSDHAPWTAKSKQADVIFDNASGAPGVQTLLAIILGKGYFGGRLSLLRCAEVLSGNPAALFGIDHRKGAIAVGRDADLVIIDPSRSTNISSADMLSNAGWTPYQDMEVMGRIEATLVRGQPVYTELDGVTAPLGTGEFVGRKH